MTETLHHYINGERVAGESGRFGDVFNPATGEVAARVPFASAAEMRQAVAAAKAALPGWAATTPIARARVMFASRISANSTSTSSPSWSPTNTARS